MRQSIGGWFYNVGLPFAAFSSHFRQKHISALPGNSKVEIGSCECSECRFFLAQPGQRHPQLLRDPDLRPRQGHRAGVSRPCLDTDPTRLQRPGATVRFERSET